MFRSAVRTLGPLSTTTARSLSTTCICRSYKRKPASSTSRTTKPTSTVHLKRKVDPKVPTILLENRCAFVRTWDLLRNPAEALALIRAVEQKYGPVERFSFDKDFDSPSVYQAQVKITFEDVESFRRLPEDFETLHIRAPKVQPKRPGGIGLDEIQHAVSEDVEFLTADQVSEIASEERTIDFRIERAKRPYFEESPYRFKGLSHNYRREIGTKMLEWGGFHEMKPIDSTRPITNEELTEETLDHVHMRRTLREWAGFLNVRNPYEVYPEAKEEQDGDSSGADSKEVRESLSTATAERSMGTSRPKPPSSPDEWGNLNAPSQVRTISEPIERLLEMEDITATTKVPLISEDELQPQDTSTEELLSSSRVPSEESTIPTSLSQSKQTRSGLLFEAQPTIFATDLLMDSANSPLQTEQPKVFGSQGSEAPREAELPPRPPSPPPSKPEAQQVDPDVQLADAKGSEGSNKPNKNSTSGMDRATTPKLPPKDESEALKDEPNYTDLEHNPRFGSFFNRLQDLLKKP